DDRALRVDHLDVIDLDRTLNRRDAITLDQHVAAIEVPNARVHRHDPSGFNQKTPHRASLLRIGAVTRLEQYVRSEKQGARPPPQGFARRPSSTSGSPARRDSWRAPARG